jgi:putative N6-adenine-specific DNA methylase
MCTRGVFMATAEGLAALAVTAPGLAPLTAHELLSRGIVPTRVSVEGVSFRGSLADVCTANLWLRTASRVLVRLADFHADSFHELERRAQRVPWDRYVTPAVPVRFRITCRKSRLYHSDAVAQRLGAAVQKAGGTLRVTDADSTGADDEPDDPAPEPNEQLVVVRVYHDRCAISLDSSGALLHRRGYRQQTAKAPLRETLAAATLLAAGWHGQCPLLDPMCGAGTLAIEGAWLARDRAPGLDRAFTLMHWPEFDRRGWYDLVAAARAAERAASVAIQASDRDAGAVAATGANAARAGVAGDIELSQRPLSGIEPVRTPGWLVTNPPYGVRVGTRATVRDLYAHIGEVARSKCPGWMIAVVAADPELARQLGFRLTSRLRTVNGGIPVEVLTASVGSGDAGVAPT